MTTTDLPVTSLVTLQFSWGGLFDGRPADGHQVHLVRSTSRGTPGPTLCGIDRFAPETPGWSIGGGLDGHGITHKPCRGCVTTAHTEFPGLPISGSAGAKEIRAALAKAVEADERAHAGLGIPCTPCAGPCTIDDEKTEASR
jgi:hypothetical protein